ncbi:MAG: chloramphenicol acetyltransferase CAT [Clostridiales bacterium]|nr:chloramphenicol acetyltransferase CAT [Clostridiales bacterium]
MFFKKIDMETWSRKDCFNHFSTVAQSTYSITVDVDITKLMEHVNDKKLRLFPTFTWIVASAINNHEEFRMGYDENGNLGIFNEVYPYYSVMDEDTKVMDTLCTPFKREFKEFYKNMIEDTESYGREKKKTKWYPNYFIASCIPWMSYSSFTASNESGNAFFFPMVTWGKFHEVNGNIVMPLTLQIHHAVADGYHCSLFYSDVEKMLEYPEKYLKL